MNLDELLKRKDELRLDLNEKFQLKSRRNRIRKSLSSGVSAMKASLKTNSDSGHSSKSITTKASIETSSSTRSSKAIENEESKDDSTIVRENTDTPMSRRRRRLRSMSAPDTIAQMRIDVTNENALIKTQQRQSPPLPNLIEGIPTGNIETSGKVRADIEAPLKCIIDENLADADIESKEIMAKVSTFLQSFNYKLMSFLFGSMLAFFFLGMRIESLLIIDDILSDSYNTYHFELYESFWLLFTCLSCFVLEGLIFVGIFCNKTSSIHLMYAGVFGAVVGATSLCLLVIAESQRTDGPFGGRKQGGVGGIEPWVAILLFRDLRWSVGEWM